MEIIKSESGKHLLVKCAYNYNKKTKSIQFNTGEKFEVLLSDVKEVDFDSVQIAYTDWAKKQITLLGYSDIELFDFSFYSVRTPRRAKTLSLVFW